MKHFNQLPEFIKEFKKLSKKYKSLESDLSNLEKILEELPTGGGGKNFTIIHTSPSIQIIKTRMACRYLKDRSIRIIYAHHENVFTFTHIEIYYKGDKENEDRERIREYIEIHSKPLGIQNCSNPV